jgi:hypothetical protein
MADSCLARGYFAMQPIDTFAIRACIGEAPFLQLLAQCLIVRSAREDRACDPELAVNPPPSRRSQRKNPAISDDRS